LKTVTKGRLGGYQPKHEHQRKDCSQEWKRGKKNTGWWIKEIRGLDKKLTPSRNPKLLLKQEKEEGGGKKIKGINGDLVPRLRHAKKSVRLYQSLTNLFQKQERKGRSQVRQKGGEGSKASN